MVTKRAFKSNKLREGWLVGWLFLINVDLAIFQPYLDLEAGDNQSLKIQVARRGTEGNSITIFEINHLAQDTIIFHIVILCLQMKQPCFTQIFFS